ncbi:hypothetical protein K438DRAFT_1906287 [Mycena galopus ATCC 62051]|nr:hypothetical protein K438DRAFT_1906287 [Mycena galopus ATCC 62051]
MSRSRAANRYQVLSSDYIEGPDDCLPPSDPPEPLSGSEDEDGVQTPIPPRKLLPAETFGDSSPLAARGPRRIYRHPRSSSAPPVIGPTGFSDDEDVQPHPTSEDVLYSPHTERRFLNARKQSKRQQTLAAKFLDEMHKTDVSLAEFMDHVFDPDNTFTADWRWNGFFFHRALVERIFGYWTSSRYNHTTRNFMHEWATKHVVKRVYSEARAITISGILNKAKKAVNERFFLDFSLANLTQSLRERAPTAFAIFDSFSTTTRQKTRAKEAFMKKKELMKGCAALTLLRGSSQNNSYAQAVMSTYLAATGGQRQHYSVLSLYGFSLGYTTTIAKAEGEEKNKPKKAKEKKRKRRARGPGIFSTLRDACMATIRALASSRTNMLVYDNINLMNRIAEQILGRKNAQENGTCATLIPLHNASRENLLTSDLDESIFAAKHLTIDDISLNPTEAAFFENALIHTIVRIIVRHGGEGFAKWQADTDATLPVSAEKIEVHKTPIHPLPTMEIDESTIIGNIEVMEEIMRVLGIKADDPEYAKYLQLTAGDQLSIARQRSILQARLGHESRPQSWRHIVPVPGLFHAKIADCHGVLETHLGKSTVRSPGSLGFHNTVLDRLPITLTSLPPFRTCRDLIMVSLYARVLHCLLLVSGKKSLETCAESIDSYSTLVSYAKEIYTTYADAERVEELRERRIPEERKRDAEVKAAKKAKSAEPAASHIPKGDMVLENAILFLRDALLTREFSDAIKIGDSGRVVLVLRAWTFCYRGSGRSKYAHEMLHLMHNLTCVWTRELRYIILQNWLANPQGKFNCFVELDLVQEHLNFWIKKIYKADGAGHSWEWLSLISPCVDILRQLATKINNDIGARQGSKHSSPDLSADITALMTSLAEHEVYQEKEGRVLDADDKPVPDVLSVGMAALTHGSSITPLAEFNQQFDVLRERRRLTPATDLLPLINVPTHDTQADPAPTAQSASVEDEPEEMEDADDGDETTELPDSFELDQDAPLHSTLDLDGEEDLFAVSPTLTRFDEGDVEFDMDDAPEWFLDEGDDSSESDSEEGEM